MTLTWDERYAPDTYLYGTEPNDFLSTHLPRLSPGSRILCLAEGEGRNAVFLAEAGHEVVALDQSSVGLQKAERLAEERGVRIETVRADLAQHRIEAGAWDAIVSIWCHVPGPVRAQIHRQVVGGLRPGGLLLLEAYTPDQLKHKTGGPPVAAWMPTLAQLRDELAELEPLHAVELERMVHEGKAHDGLSAVVQLVGRKPAVADRP